MIDTRRHAPWLPGICACDQRCIGAAGIERLDRNAVMAARHELLLEIRAFQHSFHALQPLRFGGGREGVGEGCIGVTHGAMS
jgi:hypothetical protein